MPFPLQPCPLCHQKARFYAEPPPFDAPFEYAHWPFTDSFKIACTGCHLTLENSDPVELIGRWQSREPLPAQAEEVPGLLMPGCVELAKTPEPAGAGIGIEWHIGGSSIELDSSLPSNKPNITISIEQPLEMPESPIGMNVYLGFLPDIRSPTDVSEYPGATSKEPVPPNTLDEAAPASEIADEANVKKLPAKLARGTRISPDWKLTEENHEIAKQLGVLYPKTLAESFYDYWTAVPGVRGYKLDWDATWRNWCRRSVEFHENRNARRRA